jgi:hypothetical protein
MPQLTPRRAAALLRASAAAVALLLLVLSATGPASAAPFSSRGAQHGATKQRKNDRATFGVRPATKGKPDDRTILSFGMTPGAVASDEVALVNQSLATYTFQVYSTDAVNDANGTLTLLPPDKKPTDAGSWITIGGRGASGKVVVGPRSYVVVPIGIQIPTNATPGDHVAGVVTALVAVSHGQQVNVRLNQRVGLRVFIRVAGNIRPALSIEHLTTNYHDNWNPIGSGAATVAYRVRNNGNVALGVHQQVTVSGLFGDEASTTPRAITLLLPGEFVDVRTHVSGIFPEIRMNTKVQLRPLVPAGNLDVGLKNVYSANEGFWAVPWVLIGIIMAFLLGTFFGWRWWRKRRSSAGRHSAPKNASRTPANNTAGVGA